MVVQEKPGCFGLPIAVSANSASCQSCLNKVSCLFEADTFLGQLSESATVKRERLILSLTQTALAGTPRTGEATRAPMLVAESSRGRRTIPLTQAQADAFAVYPDRIRSSLIKLSREGWFKFARSELLAGRNPANKGWKKVFCDSLLSGGITRTDLTQAVASGCGIKPTAARMQVSVGVSIFTVGKVAVEKFGKLVLDPNLSD